jgi:hypothetical protein
MGVSTCNDADQTLSFAGKMSAQVGWRTTRKMRELRERLDGAFSIGCRSGVAMNVCANPRRHRQSCRQTRALRCYARSSGTSDPHAAVMLSVAAAARGKIRVCVSRGRQKRRGKRKTECDQQRDGEHSAKHALSIAKGHTSNTTGSKKSEHTQIKWDAGSAATVTSCLPITVSSAYRDVKGSQQCDPGNHLQYRRSAERRKEQPG